MIFTKKGLSNYLNLRETYLDSDFLISTAPATSYDTDLENFWTQTSKNLISTFFNSLKLVKMIKEKLF